MPICHWLSCAGKATGGSGSAAAGHRAAAAPALRDDVKPPPVLHRQAWGSSSADVLTSSLDSTRPPNPHRPARCDHTHLRAQCQQTLFARTRFLLDYPHACAIFIPSPGRQLFRSNSSNSLSQLPAASVHPRPPHQAELSRRQWTSCQLVSPWKRVGVGVPFTSPCQARRPHWISSRRTTCRCRFIEVAAVVAIVAVVPPMRTRRSTLQLRSGTARELQQLRVTLLRATDRELQLAAHLR